MDELVISFTGDRQQDTPPLVVKFILELFNAKPVNAASSNDVVTLFNVPLNKKNSIPINKMIQKSPFLPWNMNL